MSRLAPLQAQYDEVRTAITNIERAATDAGRDLTDAEDAETATLIERSASLAESIKAVSTDLDSAAEVASIIAKHGNKAPAFNRAAAADAPDLTAGQFMANAFAVQAGTMSKEEHLERAGSYVRAQQVTADTPGLLPEPIVGSLLSLYDATRPVWNSFAHPPMPEKGKTFIRPEITQHVATGNQAAEFDTVTSQKMTVTGNTVTKFTEAGYLDLSQQDIDWTDPSALELVIRDFADVYSFRTETRASAFIASTTSASAGWTGTDTGTVITSVMGGAQAVYTSAKRAPDTLWLATDAFYALAGLTNSTTSVSGIALLEDALSRGGTPVKIVHGPQLANGTRIIGNSQLIEAYEDRKGLIQVAQPDVLGQRIAYYGYGAFFAKSSGFVKLV